MGLEEREGYGGCVPAGIEGEKNASVDCPYLKLPNQPSFRISSQFNFILSFHIHNHIRST